MDVRVKFGDSRSNHFRDIRATHFVMDERQQTDPDVVTRRTPYGVLPNKTIICTGRRTVSKRSCMQETDELTWGLSGVALVF